MNKFSKVCAVCLLQAITFGVLWALGCNDGAEGVVLAGQIGTLLTGAGVTTNIVGQTQCESVILLGDIDTTLPLQGLTVEIDGSPFFNVQSAALLLAYSKWMNNTINGAAVIGLCLRIATGMMPRNTNYRLTNAGATTPAILAFSDNDLGVPFLVATKTINALSFDDFSQFSALFIGTSANLLNAEIAWNNGSKKTYLAQELDCMYAMAHQSEANGQLAGVTIIDNTNQSIKSVRLNTNAVGANTIMVAKLPDAAFQALRN